MSVGLTVSESAQNGVAILRLEGRLDASSVAPLEKFFDQLLEQQKRKILVDFAKVNYVSSAGMRLLLSATKKVKQMEGKLSFCFVSEEVMEVIRMAGFEKILNIYPSEQEALGQY